MSFREQLREMVAINRRILSSLDYEEILRLVVEKAAELASSDVCVLVLADANGQGRVVASVGLEKQDLRGVVVPLDERIQQALTEVVPKAESRHFVGVPIIGHGQIVGVLSCWLQEREQLDSSGYVYLSALADHAALAVEQAARSRTLARGQEHQSRILRAILDNTTDRLALLDRQLRFLEANAAYCQQVGWPRDQLVGRSFAEVRAPSAWQELLERAAISGVPAELNEVPRGAPPEASYWKIVAQPIVDAAGQVEWVVLRELEVTSLVAARLAGERSAQKLQAANEGKDNFLNTLSHELRTPMSVSLNAVELLQDQRITDSQRQRTLEILERSVRNQARLVDELLDLSRAMRGKMQLAHQPVNFAHVVNQRLETLSPELEGAELVVHSHLPEQPSWVLGDRARLGQIVVNLLTNAIKFTPPGGEVVVRLEQEAGQATLTVRDTGIGISPELMPHLFQAFRQSDSAIARSSGGLGIGLTIARSLVEHHQGTIQAASEGTGRGAEFVVRLPMMPEMVVEQLQPKPVQRVQEMLRVLVVEDNTDLRATLADLLEMMGHTVICAEDGLSAIDLARDAAPNIALIDIGLPDISGFEVARELRQRNGPTPIHLVAITGFASAENRERALQSGFNGFLTKPVDLETLRQVLQHSS